jgi:hypothetical protein
MAMSCRADWCSGLLLAIGEVNGSDVERRHSDVIDPRTGNEDGVKPQKIKSGCGYFTPAFIDIAGRSSQLKSGRLLVDVIVPSSSDLPQFSNFVAPKEWNFKHQPCNRITPLSKSVRRI